MSKQWIKLIGEELKSEPQVQVDPNEETMGVKFAVQNMRLKLMDEKGRPFVVFKTSYLVLDMRQRAFDQQIFVQLGKISLVDHLRVYQMKDLNWFIKSANSQQALIQVEVNIADKKSPKFRNCETNLKAKFGSLLINYKCETVIAILQFLKVDPVQNTTNTSYARHKTILSPNNRSLNSS